MQNETAAFKADADRAAVDARLFQATNFLFSLLRRYSVYDLCIAAVWFLAVVGTLVAGGESRAFAGGSRSRVSVVLLLTACALLPVATSIARIACALQLRHHASPLRVDLIAGAPTLFRQIALTAHHEPLGWWHWLGYMASIAYCTANVVITLVWLLVFGFSGLLASLVVGLTALSAYLSILCTSALYRKGIEENFMKNLYGHETTMGAQWARHRAREQNAYWAKPLRRPTHAK
jgi:hypothetical protein